MNKKYNFIEILVDSNNSNTSNISNHKNLISNNISTSQKTIANRITNNNTFNKLCISCIENKLIKIIKRKRNITITMSKLKKIYVDL